MRRAPRMALLAAVLGVGLVPATMWGQVAERDTAALQVERNKLRSELDRVNAEIADLKKNGRSVRNDYILRQRLADAESLARRLTGTEALLRAHGPAPVGAHATETTPPEANPTDGPEQLEAKADLLADQARALLGEAESLGRRAGQIRGRQALRRHAAGIDRDPFASFEGSKRRTISVTGGSPEAGGRGAPSPGKSGGTGGAGGSGGASGGALGPGGQGGQGGSGGNPAADSPGAVPPGDAPPSVRERDALDPATLAEIRRLESSGAPGIDAQALDRAASALRDRAALLDAQARRLREKARH